jgi:hypothetical protein
MTPSFQLRTELFELTARHQEGAASEDDRQRLHTMLQGDREARAYYLGQIQLAAHLRWAMGQVNRRDAGTAPSVTKPNVKAPTIVARFLPTWSNLGLAPRVLGVAITGLLVTYFALLMVSVVWDQIDRTDRKSHNLTSIERPAFATLTAAVDCEWKGSAPANPGERLTHSVIGLQRGSIELNFDQGARVMVEGPAEFDVLSPNSGFLRRGKLVAFVPKEAIGFTIQTETAAIVDLGTEFGVEVNELGVTDVQVVQGKVELRSGRQALRASSPSPIATIVAGEARTIEPAVNGAAPVIRKIATAPDRFARMPEAPGVRRIAVGGALASSTYPSDGLFVNNLINSSGMRGECHSCRSVDYNMWHTELGKTKNEYVLFDLGRPHSLRLMKVWNYNDEYIEDYRWRGVKQADIYVSNTSRGTPLDHPEEWKLVAEDVQFEPGTGTSEYNTPKQIPLNDLTARFVAIVIDEALGHDPRAPESQDYGDVVGLSEVQFFGVRADPPKKNPR